MNPETVVIVAKNHKIRVETSETLPPDTILIVPPRRPDETDDELIARSVSITNLAK